MLFNSYERKTSTMFNVKKFKIRELSFIIQLKICCLSTKEVFS